MKFLNLKTIFKLNFLKLIENKSYIFSRFISVSVKPLILFICLTFDFKELGTIIAMVFLISSINMMICSIPLYRDFFINYNNRSNLKKLYFKNKYKSEIIILFIFSLFFLIPINHFFENSFEIFMCSLLIFSIDKIYDEIQRLLILKKKFNDWSSLTNLKNFLLVIFLLNPILNFNIIYLAIIYFLINFLKLNIYLGLTLNFKIKKKIKKFIFSIWKNRKIYLMSYFLILYEIGDKIVIGKVYKEILTEYIFLSNIFSVPLLFILYFYISRYKAEFVNNDLSLEYVVSSKKFNYLIISTFSLVFFIVSFYFYFSDSKISIISLTFLLTIYLLKSYSIILNEIVYWKKFYKDFLFFEFLFFLAYLFLIIFVIFIKIKIDFFLFFFVLLTFFKFILKLIIFKKKLSLE